MKLKREFLVGVGSRVRFWEDGWCGPNPLCNTFPLPFSLADSKGAKVAEVFPQSVPHTLLAWQGVAVGKKRKRIWLAAPLCLFWTLWRVRNRLVFENEGFNIQKLKSNLVTNLWTWANVSRVVKTNSVVDFLTWLGSR